jgi:ABC-2 type transport system permease protein
MIARTHLVTALRERITLFWFLIFPVFLLTLLALIFGQTGREGEINFAIALLNRDHEVTQSYDFAAMVEGLFEQAGTTQIEGKEPLFTLHRPKEGEDIDAFIVREQAALQRGRRAAVLIIPEGFSHGLSRRIMDLATQSDESIEGTPALIIYMSRNSVASEMATAIIEQILTEADRKILAQAGLFDESEAVTSETSWVGEKTSEVRYVDFLLPGVILMGFFTNGLFGIPGAILFARDQKVLRRYWVTPLTVPRFLAGLSIGHLSLCLVQFLILFFLGRFAFGATISFAGITPALLLLLAATTFMAFGFLIAAVARTANAGMAIANVLNMPLMFLSGLFFPTGGLPAFLMVIVYANPVSYLVDGVRTSVGAESGIFSMPLVIGVPLIWIVLSAGLAAWRLRWDAER